MASNFKTPHGLNMWDSLDKPGRADFNADNEMLDTGAMWKSDYDPSGAVAQAGGIAGYVGSAQGLASTRSVTLHVSPSGNDADGDGSQQRPYRSINYAIGKLPRILLNHAVIQLAPGDYPEYVVVEGFAGGAGMLTIKGGQTLNDAPSYRIERMAVTYCCNRVDVIGLQATDAKTDGRSGFYVARSQYVYFNACCDDAKSATVNLDAGFIASRGASMHCDNCSASHKVYGFRATAASRAHLEGCIGTGNQYIYTSNRASVLAIRNCTATGTNTYYTGGGGLILGNQGAILGV